MEHKVDDYKSAQEWFESFETIKLFKKWVDKLGDEHGCTHPSIWDFMLAHHHEQFSVWKCEYFQSPCYKIVAKPGLNIIHVGTSANLTEDDAKTLENVLNLVASIYVDSERLFDISIGLFKSLKEAAFETCHTCDEMDDKVPDLKDTVNACQKSGDHTGCFVMKWRQALSNAKNLFLKDNEKRTKPFIVVKTSDTPLRVVIESDTVGKFHTLDEALEFVKKESNEHLANLTGQDKYFCTGREVSEDGRLTVVFYGTNFNNRLNTVWRIVELPH